MPRRLALLVTSLALCACGNGSTSGAGGSGGDAGSSDAPSATGHDAAGGADSGAPVADASGTLDGAADAGEGGAKVVRSLGYYTGTQGSYDAIGSFHTYVNMVSTDVFAVQSDGSITGSDDLGALAYDTGHGIDTFACISNYSETLGDFDPALAHAAMVTNEAALVAAAVKLASGGYRGINVDFESLAYSANVADDRAAYSAFIADLGKQLHAQGLSLAISVPAKAADTATDTWSYPYDFAALGPNVDWVQLMTYDENGPGWSGPGPVSGADWVETSVVYAASVLPPSKILIGLPAYGYDWDLTASNPAKNTWTGTSVAWKDVPALLGAQSATKHWDAASSSPYVDYTAGDGHQHEAWYEDAQSIPIKTALVAKHGLGGLSMWALGDEDVSFWQAAYAGKP